MDVTSRILRNPAVISTLLSCKAIALFLPIRLIPILFLCACTDLPLWAILQQKASVADYRHFDNAVIKRAERASPLPSRKDANFHVPEIVAGEAFDATMERSGTSAFIVLQHGTIIAERYYNGYQRASIVTSFSVAKSVVSALLGIALGEGAISNIDEPITRYLPELLKNDPRFSRISLRHLLEMRSGILFDDTEGSPWSDAAAFYLTSDLQSKLAKLKIERAPDQVYDYNSGDTQLLGMAIQRATGMPLPSYLEQKIWQPMGAAYDASWSLDSAEHGIAKAFCCINARAIDFSRFGLLYLNQGKLNGRQIVPAGWVQLSTAIRDHVAQDFASRWNIENIRASNTAYYTWHWRRMPAHDPGTGKSVRPTVDFYAEGMYGQLVYIAPRQDMVIVRAGQQWGNVPWLQLFGRIAELNSE